MVTWPLTTIVGGATRIEGVPGTLINRYLPGVVIVMGDQVEHRLIRSTLKAAILHLDGKLQH